MGEALEEFGRWTTAHQTDILVNLLAGLIAAIVLLVCQTGVIVVASLLHDILTRRLKIRRLFGLSTTGEPIVVISGSLNPKQPLLEGPDARAAAQIHLTLEQVFRRRRVLDTFSASPDEKDLPHTDYCAVGGPEFNACARNTLAHLAKYVNFDAAGRLNVVACNKTFEAEYEGGAAVKDYGLLVRVRSPMDEQRRALIVAGCDTYGVYAAAQLLTDSRRFRSLYGRFRRKRGIFETLANKDYIAVVSCRPVGSDIAGVEVELVCGLPRLA
jgi:hypothetical protein